MEGRELPPGPTCLDQFFLDPVAGREALAELYSSATAAAEHANIAMAAASIGDTELALAAYRDAVLIERIWIPFGWRTVLQPIRSEPGFKALMSELGLVGHWRTTGWPTHCRPVGDEDFECF